MKHDKPASQFTAFHCPLSCQHQFCSTLPSSQACWFTLILIVASGAAAVMKHKPWIVRPLSLLFAVSFTMLTQVADRTYQLAEDADLVVRPAYTCNQSCTL